MPRRSRQESTIVLRLPPDLFHALEEKRSKSEASFEDIGRRLFEVWLACPEGMLEEQLPTILQSGDRELIDIATKAISVSYGLIKHAPSQEEIEQWKADAARRRSPNRNPDESS